jgi:hypothetical protein
MFRMFRVFGHKKVWVLDGGLPQWQASGFNVEKASPDDDAVLKSIAANRAVKRVYNGEQVSSNDATHVVTKHSFFFLLDNYSFFLLGLCRQIQSRFRLNFSLIYSGHWKRLVTFFNLKVLALHG